MPSVLFQNEVRVLTLGPDLFSFILDQGLAYCISDGGGGRQILTYPCDPNKKLCLTNIDDNGTNKSYYKNYKIPGKILVIIDAI